MIGPAPTPAPSPATFSVTLGWTAPGDDGRIGRAQHYELRYSTSPITASNFSSATLVGGVPPPAPSGSMERFTITGLDLQTFYYFALKSRDDAGNWSALSNVVVYPELTAGAERAPAVAGVSVPYPNPARAETRCAIALPGGADVRADVFGVDGRHVRRLADGWRPAGRSELVWDLRDQAGVPVAAGIYLVRARLGSETWTRRLTVVR